VSGNSTPRDFWIDHLWMDLAIAALIVAAHGTLVALFPSTDILGRAQPGDRRAAYSSAAIVVSLLGSFSAVAIGQLSSAKGARADALRAQGGVTLAASWRSIFRAGLLAALVSIFALVLDPSTHTNDVFPVVVRWIFEGTLVLAVVKFFRLSSLFSEVIKVATKSASEPEEEQLADAPVARPGWNKRAG
jgi:hypothetical protein